MTNMYRVGPLVRSAIIERYNQARYLVRTPGSESRLALLGGPSSTWEGMAEHYMVLKKSQLYGSLWKSCDELRGGMDASQYKDYVLVLLFMKYVSDKAASRNGYLLDVPKGGSFADM